MINYIPKQNNIWRAVMKELKAMRQEYSTNAGKMSEYERQSIGRKIKEQTESQASYIITAALAEQSQAINLYQTSENQVETADAAELKRWDPVRLNAERSNMHAAAGAALANSNPLGGRSQAQGLEEIYREAKKRNDIHATRAAVEVLTAITDKVTDPKGRAEVAAMTGDLQKMLAEQRVTPQMIAAREAQAAAAANLYKVTDGLREVAQAIGEGDPATDIWGSGSMSKAMRRVKISPDHTQAEILSDDDPELTGWVLHEKSTTVAGG